MYKHAKLLHKCKIFFAKQYDIKAVAILRSCLRDHPSTDADIDFLILTTDPRVYLQQHDWLDQFGEPLETAVERDGLVTTLRAWYQEYELAFHLSTTTWASYPIDAGTARVVKQGMQILYDPKDILANLVLNLKASAII